MNHFGLEGLDPVAFLGHFRKVQGKARYKSRHRGKTYFFTSQQNLDIFEIQPERFLPQIEGYCPFVYATTGKFAPGNPNYGQVVGDKLYLCSTSYFAVLCRHLPFVTRVAWTRYHKISARPIAA